MRIRYIDDILLLIITNFMSWALEEHPEPEIQHAKMQLVSPSAGELIRCMALNKDNNYGIF